MRTLQEAIDYVRANRRKGLDCPCCDQFAKEYKRKLNSGMARVLIVCYPSFRDYPGRFLDVVNYCATKHDFVASNHALLVAWGLLEKKEGDRPDGSSRNSMYRLTKLGEQFVLNQVRVPSHWYFYDDEALGPADGTISIAEALGNHFDYRELMAA